MGVANGNECPCPTGSWKCGYPCFCCMNSGGGGGGGGGGCCTQEAYESGLGPPPAPVKIVNFSYRLLAGLEVEFDVLLNSHAVVWNIDFGDNTESEFYRVGLGTVYHTYSGTGTFTAELKVIDLYHSRFLTKTIEVVVTNEGFYAEYSYTTLLDYVKFINETTVKDAAFLWDFGDGEFSQEKHPLHKFPSSGNYTVELTATDTDGKEYTVSKVVSVSFGSLIIDTFSDDNGVALHNHTPELGSWTYSDPYDRFMVIKDNTLEIEPAAVLSEDAQYEARSNESTAENLPFQWEWEVKLEANILSPRNVSFHLDIPAATFDNPVTHWGNGAGWGWNVFIGHNYTTNQRVVAIYNGGAGPYFSLSEAGSFGDKFYKFKFVWNEDTGIMDYYLDDVLKQSTTGGKPSPQVGCFAVCHYQTPDTGASYGIAFMENLNVSLTPALGGPLEALFSYNDISPILILDGTIAVTKNSQNVVGTGTEFTAFLSEGDYITIEGIAYPIAIVTDDTNLVLAAQYQGDTDSGLTTRRALKVEFLDGSSSHTTDWEWSIDGVIYEQQNPDHVFANGGTFIVGLTITHPLGTSYAEQAIFIPVASSAFTVYKPASIIGTDVMHGVSPLSVAFTGESKGNPTAWDWDFGTGSPATSSNQDQSVTFTGDGEYLVKFKATNPFGESEEAHLTIMVGSATASDLAPYSNPVVDKRIDLPNTEFQFTANPSYTIGVEFEWDFGDGSTSSEENPTHSYDEKGWYMVKLTTSGPKGITTAQFPILVATSYIRHNGFGAVESVIHNQTEDRVQTYDSNKSNLNYWAEEKIGGIAVSVPRIL